MHGTIDNNGNGNGVYKVGSFQVLRVLPVVVLSGSRFPWYQDFPFIDEMRGTKKPISPRKKLHSTETSAPLIGYFSINKPVTHMSGKMPLECATDSFVYPRYVDSDKVVHVAHERLVVNV